MGAIGDYFSRLSYVQSVLLVCLPIMLIAGLGYGGYLATKGLAEVKCLGCLGLNPSSAGFEDFWIDYPDGYDRAGQAVDHPPMVTTGLQTKKMVMIFIWTPACSACEEQWEDMKAEGLVSGTEANGKLEGYDSVDFHSINANANDEYRHVLETYHPHPNKLSAPMTIFCTYITDDTGAEVIGWYAQLGYMSPGDVTDILQLV